MAMKRFEHDTLTIGSLEVQAERGGDAYARLGEAIFLGV
jgi:hypothetical protein